MNADVSDARTTSGPGGREPLLSVVVPFYNVVDYLGQCLETIASQFVRDIEVILVDDGSDDGSQLVADEVVARDGRFRLIRQPNAGIGPARTRGADAARGRYLAFVDGDDVVAPRGWWHLVQSLERTGSDIAAGNVKRFTAARGSYQSWTHAEPFARPRETTTLEASPDLIRDRMVWNKVYRRSFWAEGGYRFPNMRYEDYPVVLDAYLAARGVDVLSDYVYFWRERESGTSITQQRTDLGNAEDRAASAHMILTALDRHPEAREVRGLLEAYLARVDVVSLAQTMVLVPEGERRRAERLATDLARRLDADAHTDAPRLGQLINVALREGDMPTARALARWHANGEPTALARDLVATRSPRAIPSVARAVVAAKAPQHPLRARRLRSTLSKARWEDDALRLTVTTRLRPAFAHRARVHASVTGHGWGVTLERLERTGTGLTCHLLLRPTGPKTPAARLPLTLRLALPGSVMRWQGTVDVDDPDVLPSPRRVGPSLFTLVAEPEVALVEHTPDEVWTVSAVAHGDTFLLDVPAHPSSVRVSRPAPTPSIDVPVRDGRATLEPRRVLADDVADDPISGLFQREIVAVHEGRPRPLLLEGDVARATIDGVAVQIGRNRHGHAVLRRTRPTSQRPPAQD